MGKSNHHTISTKLAMHPKRKMAIVGWLNAKKASVTLPENDTVDTDKCKYDNQV